MATENQEHPTKKGSLRTRLLVGSTLGLLITFLIIGLAIYSLSQASEKTSWDGRQQEAARNASETIASFVRGVSSSMDLLGVIDDDYLVANPSLVEDWLVANPELLEIVRINQDGLLVAGVAQDQLVLSEQFPFTETNWFETARQGNFVLGDVQFSAENEPYITLAKPIANNGGVIAGRLSMNMLLDVVSSISFGQSGLAYIVDQNGVIVAHPDNEVVLAVTSIQDRPEWQQIVAQQGTTALGDYSNFLDGDVLGRATAVGGTGWVVVTEIDQSEVTEASRWILLFIGAGLIGATLLLLGGIFYLLNNYVFRPINTIQSGAQRITQGNFGEQITVQNNDEIGELASVFNKMTSALSTRDKRIAAQTEALAEEVQERKETQENLQRLNAELVKSSRYKDQFLATMSHELRTPLNAILGMAEALMVPVYGEMNDQQQKAVLHVRESGQHLLALIDDILDLSKIAAGKSPLEFNAVYVEQIARASIRMVRPTTTTKNLQLKTHIDENVTVLTADERRLKQILVNLLNNAVKFTDEGGQVGLEISGVATEGVVKFIVWDSGIGIPAESMSNLFEPFMQLDGGLARHYGGTGLGLALVHRLVDMHGGSVTVESEEGKGSRFTVMLPWNEPADVVQTDDDGELYRVDSGRSSASGAHILLAEDREANILTLLDYLTIKGFDVSVARNGLQAVDMASQLKPDLILMDIQMPEMNGLDAIQLIRDDVETAYVPIVALTALAMPGDRERCIQAGANDYISKPVSLRQLVLVIEQQLERMPVAD